MQSLYSIEYKDFMTSISVIYFKLTQTYYNCSEPNILCLMLRFQEILPKTNHAWLGVTGCLCVNTDLVNSCNVNSTEYILFKFKVVQMFCPSSIVPPGYFIEINFILQHSNQFHSLNHEFTLKFTSVWCLDKFEIGRVCNAVKA